MAMSEKKVKQIKELLRKGVKQAEVARQVKKSRSTISDIATGRLYPDVGEPVPTKNSRRKAVPEYDPTDDRVQELEAELSHVTAERDHARRQVKANAKVRGLFNAIVGEMEQRVQPIKPLPPAYRPASKGAITEHLVVHVSDMHADQVVTPEECGGMEEFNFPIACARAEHYVDTIVEWTQETLAPKFNFPSLTVLMYGDMTSGEIHGHGQRSYYRNQFKNCFAIGQLQALMLRDLAQHFPTVNVVCVPGNHGRRTAKKDYHGAHDNFDYLIAKVAELHCADLGINFLIPDSWSVNLDINGVGFNVSHGDDVRGSLGIPFYGMARRQKGLIALNSMQAGPRIRYFVMGHHHTASSLSDIDGELLVNGAWVGTDSFSYNAFSGYREPSQWVHGVNPRYGITWRLKVNLRHDAEKKGPQRYVIDGGREVGPL